MRGRRIGSVWLLALAASGCATVPLAWQVPGTGALATEAEVAECRQAALLEVNQRWPIWYGGFGAFPRRDPFWPGWGFRSGAFWELSRLEALQDLTAFCLRVKGYRLLPLTPQVSDASAPPPPSAESPRPTEAPPRPPGP